VKHQASPLRQALHIKVRDTHESGLLAQNIPYSLGRQREALQNLSADPRFSKGGVVQDNDAVVHDGEGRRL